MLLADYHTHSYPLSPDAHDSMRVMAEAALRRGVGLVCFTNHIDNCALVENAVWGPVESFEPMERELQETREALGDRLELRLGAEISAPHYVPEEGRRLCEHGSLDFVIGSIHNLRNRKDFYEYDYPANFEALRPEIEEYLDEHLALVEFGGVDVLGHIGYMRKYMSRQGKFFDMMAFSDRLREIFTRCVEKGIGIEVNTSALRSPLGDFIPGKDVLKLYRACGGEIVTTGSDSHRASDAGAGISEAVELLRECGFRYMTVFRKRKPEFIKI